MTTAQHPILPPPTPARAGAGRRSERRLVRCALRIALPAALALGAGACATRVPPTPPDAGMATVPRGPYRIQVGDQLDVRFYQTPELNLEAVPVRSDGMISVEIVGDVAAAGSTPAELSDRLVGLYAGELERPRITVIVRAFAGQVYVGGAVGKPAGVPFADGLTALQAVHAVGGFTDEAEPTTVALLRRGADGQWRGYALDLTRAISGEDPGQDVVLQPADIVHVPNSRIANLNTIVEQYIRNMLPIQPGLGLPVI